MVEIGFCRENYLIVEILDYDNYMWVLQAVYCSFAISKSRFDTGEAAVFWPY